MTSRTATLVDGRNASVVSAYDRGLAYGDGVFETVRIRDGRPRHWARHLARLRDGLRRLGIASVSEETLAAEVATLAADRASAVVKITVTRGAGRRGYSPAGCDTPTRIVACQPLPDELRRDAVTLRWCRTPLAPNPALAGIKHLNRLEQVLARAEWTDPAIAEGLVCDTRGRVISACAANVFIESAGTLITPALDRAGVEGVMRAVIMHWMENHDSPVQQADLYPDDIRAADAVFVTNSLIGLWPVARLIETGRPDCTYATGRIARRLLAADGVEP